MAGPISPLREPSPLARFTPLRAQDLLKRHGFGATMHMLNPNKYPSPPHSERRRLHF